MMIWSPIRKKIWTDKGIKAAGILLCLLYVALDLFGQGDPSNYFARRYLFQERLAQGLVFDILQDRQGFMWFATELGLIRYDGHAQKKYEHEPANPYSLAGNVVTCLAEDATGNLWVGTMASGLHYFDRRSGRFMRYQYDAGDPGSIANNKIKEILIAGNGALWITTEGGGVQLYDERTGKFRRFMQPNMDRWSTDALLEDGQGRLWVGGYFGLDQWSPADSAFVRKAWIRELDQSGNTLTTLVQDAFGRIWAGFRNGGLTYFDPGVGRFQPVISAPAWPRRLEDNHIWDIYVEGGRDLWVATDGLLFCLEQGHEDETPRLSVYDQTKEARFLSLCKSRDGVMWVGTNDGVIVLTPRYKQFGHFQALKAGEADAPKRGVTVISPGRESQLWVGTIEGTFQFDSQARRFHQSFLEKEPLLRRFANSNISTLYFDKKDNLWIATIEGFDQGFGLFCYQFPEKKLVDFSRRSEPFHAYPTNHIVGDHFGRLWFANDHGLLRYDPESDQVEHFRHNPQDPYSLNGDRITRVFLSSRNELWIGTNDAGLARYDFEMDRFYTHDLQSGDFPSVSNKRIMAIFEDHDRQLWLGTAGGLVRFDPQTESIGRFDSRHGLADNLVRGIFQDGSGVLWMNSETGIARLNPEEGVFTNYRESDGLLIREFWSGNYAAPDGRLYFGGHEGLLVFHPDSIRDNAYEPPVVFTDFLLFNKEVSLSSGSKLLPAPIHFSPDITLRHDQNVFTIGFAALSYINPKNTRYAIRMDGFEHDWQDVGRKTEATYTNLDPGTYFFRVKATNSDGVGDEEGASLKIIVLPPWYRAWWAYLAYVVLFSGMIYTLYHFQLNRRLAIAEAERLRELDAFKTNLYTNITHEFRTPLTLIQGPVERAIQEPAYVLGRRELERIRKNCRRLLNLIRQMLDLNKLEAGALKVNYAHADVLPALKYIVDAFTSFAESQDVQLRMEAPDAEIFMDQDQEKLFDIVSNLVSNAIKFSPAGGQVMIEVRKTGELERPRLEILVRDNGIGIPPEELDRIFDRFYQVRRRGIEGREESVSGGSGIGLTLSKKLAELMNGSLSVNSEVGKGSVFRLQLPIRRVAGISSVPPSFPDIYLPKTIQREEIGSTNESSEGAEGPSILIVEDNGDVAQFIAESLPRHYHKRLAKDGRQGVDMATEFIPDLIISDVLMPGADGFLLTETLKNDHRTSHIPIILLTAKADLDSLIEGLSKGADAYLAKPFHGQELLIRIENLLESRRRLQFYYLQQSGLQEAGREKEEADEQENVFLRNVRRLIEEHLDQGGYSVEDLARDLHMSASQLYRKMTALTGRSPIKFYRGIQIAVAKEFLVDSDLSVSEIAYRIGFNDPAYFTRVFTAETGQAPSAYRGQLGE